jgi:hypothetical protein
MDMGGVCMRCAQTAAVPPTNATIAEASKSSIWSSDTHLIVAILVPVLLIGGVVGGWVLWSAHADREMRDQISILKDAGDRRLAAGDAEAASKQYAALLAYVLKNKIKDDDAGTLADVRRQKELADTAVAKQAETHQQQRQREATAQAAEQRRGEIAAGNKFLDNAKPFLDACSAFRAAYDDYVGRQKAIVGADDIKAAMDSESQMLDAMRALVEKAKIVQPAFDAIPKELHHVQTLCNVIRAAAADLMTAYDKYSSAPSDMARLRLARMTGAEAEVDAQATQRNYTELVSSTYSMAGIALGTAPTVGGKAQGVSQNSAGDAPASESIDSNALELLKQQIAAEEMVPDKLLACLRNVAQRNSADAEPVVLQLQSRLSRLRTWDVTQQIAINFGYRDIQVSPNGRYVLYVVDGTGNVQVLDATTGQTRPWGQRWQRAFVGSDRVVEPVYFNLIYRRIDDGKESGKAKLPVEENASFEYGWIAASPSGNLVARFGPVTEGMGQDRDNGKPIFVMDANSGATAALLNGGETQTGCFAPVGPAALVSAGEAEMTVWDLSRTGGRLLHHIVPKAPPAPSNQVTVPWIGISYGREVSISPYRSGAIESFNIDTGQPTRQLGVPGCETVYGMTPDGMQFLLGKMPSSPSPTADRDARQVVFFDAASKQQHVLPGLWKNAAVSLNGQTVALISNDRVVVMQARSGAPWQAKADHLCNTYLVNRWGNSDSAMLADASTGRGDTAARNRMNEVAHDQKTQAEREAATIAQAQHDAEFGADKPRAIATALIEKAKQQGKLRDGKFIGYFESGGVHQWDKLPSGVNEVGLRFRFEFVTQAGLVRTHDGYIMFRQRDGKWEPFVINIDGMGDITVKVFTEGGFVIR